MISWTMGTSDVPSLSLSLARARAYFCPRVTGSFSKAQRQRMFEMQGFQPGHTILSAYRQTSTAASKFPVSKACEMRPSVSTQDGIKQRIRKKKT